MDYLVSHHTLIWLWFIIYAVTIVFLIPNSSQKKAVLKTVEADKKKALDLGSKIILRTVLIFPMLFLLKNAI